MASANQLRFLTGLLALLLGSAGIWILWRTGLPASPDFFLNFAESDTAPLMDHQVPPIEAITLDGASIVVPSIPAQPTIINFWATWCVPCVEEMPLLEILHRDGWRVIGINAGLEEPDDVQAWVEQVGITFPIVMDDRARTFEARFGVRGLPATFFVDEQGIIRHIERGALSEESLLTGLRAIRTGQP